MSEDTQAAGSANSSEDRGGPGRFDSFTERFELVIAILLGLAAIVGAIAAFQTGKKDGDTLASFQEGNRVADKASRLNATASAKRNNDQIATTFAIQAVLNSKAEGAAADRIGDLLINTVGSPELQATNKKCTETDDCKNLIDSKYYAVPEAAQAAALDKKADQLFANANEASSQGDDYSLVTVLLASALFLYGVAAVGRGRPVKLGMAGAGLVIFLISVGMLLTV